MSAAIAKDSKDEPETVEAFAEQLVRNGVAKISDILLSTLPPGASIGAASALLSYRAATLARKLNQPEYYTAQEIWLTLVHSANSNIKSVYDCSLARHVPKKLYYDAVDMQTYPACAVHVDLEAPAQWGTPHKHAAVAVEHVLDEKSGTFRLKLVDVFYRSIKQEKLATHTKSGVWMDPAVAAWVVALPLAELHVLADSEYAVTKSENTRDFEAFLWSLREKHIVQLVGDNLAFDYRLLDEDRKSEGLGPLMYVQNEKMRVMVAPCSGTEWVNQQVLRYDSASLFNPRLTPLVHAALENLGIEKDHDSVNDAWYCAVECHIRSFGVLKTLPDGKKAYDTVQLHKAGCVPLEHPDYKNVIKQNYHQRRPCLSMNEIAIGVYRDAKAQEKKDHVATIQSKIKQSIATEKK